MKSESEHIVNLILNSIGINKITIPVTVIVVTDKDCNRSVKYAESLLNEHRFINKELNYAELLLLIKCNKAYKAGRFLK